MPKPWTTTEQDEWFLGKREGFLAAQKDGKVSAFFTEAEAQWFEKWPEITRLFGPDVTLQDLTPEQEDAYGSALITRKKRIRSRFYNDHSKNKKGEASGLSLAALFAATGNAKSAGTRKNQEVEVYSKLFYKEKVQSAVEADIQENNIPSNKKIGVVRRHLHTSYREESDEVKAQVKEAVAASLSAAEPPPKGCAASTPAQYQCGINALPRIAEEFMDAVTRSTGLTCFLLFGGPCPEERGALRTMAFQNGKTIAGHSFKEVNMGYEENIIEPWNHFLKGVYTREERARRALSYLPEPQDPGPAVANQNGDGARAVGRMDGVLPSANDDCINTLTHVAAQEKETPVSEGSAASEGMAASEGPAASEGMAASEGSSMTEELAALAGEGQSALSDAIAPTAVEVPEPNATREEEPMINNTNPFGLLPCAPISHGEMPYTSAPFGLNNRGLTADDVTRFLLNGTTPDTFTPQDAGNGSFVDMLNAEPFLDSIGAIPAVSTSQMNPLSMVPDMPVFPLTSDPALPYAGIPELAFSLPSPDIGTLSALPVSGAWQPVQASARSLTNEPVATSGIAAPTLSLSQRALSLAMAPPAPPTDSVAFPGDSAEMPIRSVGEELRPTSPAQGPPPPTPPDSAAQTMSSDGQTPQSTLRAPLSCIDADKNRAATSLAGKSGRPQRQRQAPKPRDADWEAPAGPRSQSKENKGNDAPATKKGQKRAANNSAAAPAAKRQKT